VKKSLLVEQAGGPLSIVIAGANVPDAHLLAATLDAIVVERPEPERDSPQHLCLDKGFDNATGWEATIERDYEPHIALIRDPRPPGQKRFKPKRWVVERTLAWLSQCRAILIRWDTKARKLSGSPQARLRPALVPSVSSPGTFEIDSKGNHLFPLLASLRSG
jgi:putative transposase